MVGLATPNRPSEKSDVLLKRARCSIWTGAAPLQHCLIQPHKVSLVDYLAPRLVIHRLSVSLVVPGYECLYCRHVLAFAIGTTFSEIRTYFCIQLRLVLSEAFTSFL